jgi:tRNA(Ile2) C34 agmatinyltransferase TiaS
MRIYLGLDDTDNAESRGTGRLARQLAAELGPDFNVLGVTRHQLLVDPRVPYTSHNSSAAITIDGGADIEPTELFHWAKARMLADYQPGSDPGLCVTRQVPEAITDFGRRAQIELVSQAEAHALARANGLLLGGLGGSRDGVIGALAAVGLAACGEDGRYLQIGTIRELQGLLPVAELLMAGIAEVYTLDGVQVADGLVQVEKLRPARRGDRPVQFVAQEGDYWVPVKLD